MRLLELAVPLDLEPMEAKSAEGLPAGEGWQFEPKWDGFRCLAFRAGSEVALRAKSGKGLERFFPEVVEQLRAAAPERFVLDGELVIEGAGFGGLQARLHPAASRIARLSRETPAELMAFDCLLGADGEALLERRFVERRAALEGLAAGLAGHGVRLTEPLSRAAAEAVLARSDAAVDGIVAKRLDGPYRPGERAMLKVKRVRTADCVVGGFRYQSRARLVGSLLLGLYDEAGRLNHVGFCSGLSAAERPELTARLEALRGESAFTGEAPGGPSRWATERSTTWEPVRPELVVEVGFDQVTDGRFRHGVSLVRWRPDKAPGQCRCEQIR